MLLHMIGRQSILFICIFFVTACFSSSENSKNVPQSRDNIANAAAKTEGNSRKVTVNVVSYGKRAQGKSEGGTESVTIEVSSKSDPGIRVGFIEGEVGGQGPSLRASGWNAAIMSSILLGIDPNKLSFTYELSSRVDGPSAGALITVGTLAAILGDNVRSDAAMTGSINPDGSIGPVGGIPHKIDGASDKGLKLLVVPAIQKKGLDENLKKEVDLAKRGEEKGVTVKFASNIYEAYQFLTEKSLPQPRGNSRPALPKDVAQKIKTATNDWLTQYETIKKKLRKVSIARKKPLRDQQKAADLIAKTAKQELKNGKVMAGFGLATQSVALISTTAQAAILVEAYQKGGIEKVNEKVVASLATKKNFSSLFETLEKVSLDSPVNTLGLIDIFSNFSIAESYLQRGDLILQAIVENEDKMSPQELMQVVVEFSANYATAQTFVEISQKMLEIYLQEDDQNSPPNLETLQGLADMLRRASEANEAAFEGLIIHPIAEAAGASDQVFRERLAGRDPHYALLSSLINKIKLLDQAQTEQKKTYSEPFSTLYELGGALNTWALSTLLVSKYYSLGPLYDENKLVADFGRKEAFLEMLSFAESRSDSLLGVTKQVPVPAIFYADNARFSKTGNFSGKIDALLYFWQSSILSEFLAIMTGTFQEKILEELEQENRGSELLRKSLFTR